MLSCDCYFDGGSDFYYSPANNFTKFNATRRKRCVSCNELVDIGSDCLEFECHRGPYSDIEEDILGTEVPIANKYLCNRCGEIYLNLTSVGYCFDLGEDLRDALKDYWEITGFRPPVSTDTERK